MITNLSLKFIKNIKGIVYPKNYNFDITCLHA